MSFIHSPWQPEPSHEQELSRSLFDHRAVQAKGSTGESGCLHSGFYQNGENENNFFVVEEWASQKESDDHLRSDLFTVLKGAKSLLSRPAETVVHAVNRSTELGA